MQKIGLEAILKMAGFNRSRDEYNQGVDGMNKKTTSLGSILKGTGKAMLGMGVAAAGIAVGAIAGLAKGLASCVGPASDLNESMNKMTVVFGKSAPEIEAWSKGAATALGMSQRVALEAAGTYGNLFTAMGMGTDISADMSMSLIQLAADLGSFNNLAPEEVLEKLRAGLVGESEPLRTLGINLSETTIKAQALKMGLLKGSVDMAKATAATKKLKDAQGILSRMTKGASKDSLAYQKAQNAVALAQENLDKKLAGGKATAAELTQAQLKLAEAQEKFRQISEGVTKGSPAYQAQQARVLALEEALSKTMEGKVGDMSPAIKAQAAYALIMEQSTTAQGDFARTSDGLANQQKILKARFEDIKATIGTALLPSIQLVGDKIIEILDSPQVQAAIKNITDWLSTKLPVAIETGLTAITTAYEKARPILEKLGWVQPEAPELVGPEAVRGPAGQMIDQAIGMQVVATGETLGKRFWEAFFDTVRKGGTAEEQAEANVAMNAAIVQWLEVGVWQPIKDWFAGLWVRIKALWSEFWSGDIFLRGLDLYGSTVPNSNPAGGSMNQPSLTGAGAAASNGPNMVNVGGDTFVMNNNDPVSFYLAQALVQNAKRTKWNAAMGVAG